MHSTVRAETVIRGARRRVARRRAAHLVEYLITAVIVVGVVVLLRQPLGNLVSDVIDTLTGFVD
jgi:C4-dicarboxylate-specific signal transduction histidine kinase